MNLTPGGIVISFTIVVPLSCNEQGDEERASHNDQQEFS